MRVSSPISRLRLAASERARAVSAAPVFASQFPDVEGVGGIHPLHAAKAVAEAAGPDAIYVYDGGEAASWAGAVTAVNRPGALLTHGYLGCLGIGPGLPSAPSWPARTSASST